MSRTRHAPSGTLRIAYELRGTLHWRRPWLVLVQGMGFDRQGWDRCCRTRRRSAMLGPGSAHGRYAGSFGVADMAGDIIAVLDHAGIRKAHVMGASLGGLVAQELAITHPERVDGLVLACTAPGWPLACPASGIRASEADPRRRAEAIRALTHRSRARPAASRGSHRAARASTVATATTSACEPAAPDRR